MLVEVLLQLFVSIVDAKLLEAVGLEGLKAEDIEDAQQVHVIMVNVTH